jgi:VanZ family protein
MTFIVKVKNTAYHFLPVAFYMGIIWFFSAQPYLGVTEEFHDSLFILRKMVHVTEFAILTVLVWRALHKSFPYISLPITILWTIIIVLGAAAMDEVHQTFVPGRHGKVLDVVIDSMGMIIVLFAFLRSQLPTRIMTNRLH